MQVAGPHQLRDGDVAAMCAALSSRHRPTAAGRRGRAVEAAALKSELPVAPGRCADARCVLAEAAAGRSFATLVPRRSALVSDDHRRALNAAARVSCGRRRVRA